MADLEVEVEVDSSAAPDGFKEYEEWYAKTGGKGTDEEKPAVGDKKPSSVPPEEIQEGETAEDSDPADDTEQEEAEEEEEEAPQGKKPGNPNKGLNRRMKELTGKIKALESQLAEHNQPEDDEEATAEVVSATEPVVAKEAVKLVRPMLKDFEDSETESAFDLWQKADDEYHDQKTELALKKAIDGHKADLQKQADELELKHATETANAAWSKAASRWPNYNELVEHPEIRLSPAMVSVMKMDPESGTELSVYFAEHPEESERIAKLTLANNEAQWPSALARAGVELGKLHAGLTPPSKDKKPAAATPAPKPETKKVTTASTPPPKIRGGTAPSTKFDVLNDDDARDVGKWMKAREAQLAASGKR